MFYQDLRQSAQWADYMKSLGWVVDSIGRTKAFVRRIPFFGSVIKIPRLDPGLPFAKIDDLAKSRKAFIVKIEPNITSNSPKRALLLAQLKKHGYNFDNWSFAPTKTFRINLSLTLEQILANMKKETRYAIRKAEKDLIVKVSNEERLVEAFIIIYKNTAKKSGFWTGPIEDLRKRWESFERGGKAGLFLAFGREAEILSGAMVFYHQKGAYYYHAASTERGRRLCAPSLLVWEIIKKAKKEGYGFLDFEGIKDTRIPSTKGWSGFTNFKKGFGGEEIEFVGSFSKYYIPVVGGVFRLIQKLGV